MNITSNLISRTLSLYDKSKTFLEMITLNSEGQGTTQNEYNVNNIYGVYSGETIENANCNLGEFALTDIVSAL